MSLRNVLPTTFALYFGAAREVNPKIREATSEFSHVPGTRYFLASEDHFYGYAVRPDGELVFVWSAHPGHGAEIVEHAITHGATHLDCFDGYLVTLYSRHGFERVTSLPNWTPGEPDVVFMARPGHFLAAVDKAGL